MHRCGDYNSVIQRVLVRPYDNAQKCMSEFVTMATGVTSDYGSWCDRGSNSLQNEIKYKTADKSSLILPIYVDDRMGPCY
jgi:hypothetical protein